MKNKIIFFNSFYPNVRGGAEFQSRKIANICLEENMDVVYISLEDTDETVFIDGIKVYKIKNPNNTWNNLTLYYFFMQKVFKILDDEQPTIIYQRILNSFSPYLAKYSNRNKLSFILHIANTHCFNFSSSIRDKTRLFLFNQLKKQQVFYISQTKEQEELLNKNQLKSSLLMPNLFDVKSEKKQDLTKPLQILWVANIRPVKQLDVFLELSTMIKDHSVKFVVIGRIEQKSKTSFYLNEMEKITNLEYLGELKNEEVNTYLSKAFLLVNTSKSEGFSNTFLQSWALGTPVVSLNSNPNNYLEEKEVGFYAKGNINEMKNAILNYINNKGLYQKHSFNSTNLFNNELDYNKSRNKIINFIKSKV